MKRGSNKTKQPLRSLRIGKVGEPILTRLSEGHGTLDGPPFLDHTRNQISAFYFHLFFIHASCKTFGVKYLKIPPIHLSSTYVLDCYEWQGQLFKSTNVTKTPNSEITQRSWKIISKQTSFSFDYLCSDIYRISSINRRIYNLCLMFPFCSVKLEKLLQKTC